MDEFQSKTVHTVWKYVCQLRVQLEKNKASLVLGAGISKDLKLPLWELLIDRIKNVMRKYAPEVDAVIEAPGKAALVLFEMFYSYRKVQLEELGGYSSNAIVEKKILSDWREMIHQALYCETSEGERRATIERHPYFRQMIDFIKKSELTVNYNFDDYIEFGLSCGFPDSTVTERPYQTVWSHHSQFTKDKCVIYHPNGFLPFDKKKFQSEHLVFSDGAFADQLLDGIGGSLSTLLHVLTKKTSILIGHSLTDSTLLHLLRKAAAISPGNYNYFIRCTSEPLDVHNQSAIFDANFNNYNLITLFFNSSDINEFLRVITLPEEEFLRVSDILGLQTKYNYYLVGAVGIGKSTVISQFGNLTTLDEWFDERPAEMARSPESLSTTKTITVDDWTNKQFGKKNNYLGSKRVGVFLIDRSPVDPLSFVVDVTEKERARSMLEEGIRPGQSKKKIESGEIIHMVGEPSEVWVRLITKRKETDWPPDKIRDLQKASLRLYGPLKPVEVVSTNRREVDVVREVAKVVFSCGYSPADLDARMSQIAYE
ncbi:SIR2 family protein [Pseudomonas syringae group sp. J309-1]|uniref:SIR2 family protein n=1 Tax=Pseudomonas syringae group sp. J309-1 TaxID=3079588 RepID=UPI0029068D24|nr:SIR2 family protein [Pseudomonas syringae group sp. J309-1]MDU8359964.1 SIR2 family protein [Pseudomonas syringae group sp. J309-1]